MTDDPKTSAPMPKDAPMVRRNNSERGMAGEGGENGGPDVERGSGGGDAAGVENLPGQGEDSRDVERPSGEDSGTNVNTPP